MRVYSILIAFLIFFEAQARTNNIVTAPVDVPEIYVKKEKGPDNAEYEMSTFILTSDDQLEIAKNKIRKKISEVKQTHRNNLLSIVSVNNVSPDSSVQKAAQQIASENETSIEEIEVTEGPQALNTAQKIKNLFKTDRNVVTMTLITTIVTGGATTTAMIYGDALSPSTCVMLGGLWAGVSGGYVFFNERFQQWLVKVTPTEKRIFDKLNIKNTTIYETLKTSGEWAKYFLHIASWNYVGYAAVYLLESKSEASLFDVLVASAGEVVSGAPWELAIANDTQRLKLKYPHQSERIQFYSNLANATNEVLAQVLSVAAITGMQKPALIGLGALATTGTIYYIKTLVQQKIDNRREQRQEIENRPSNESAPSCRSLFGIFQLDLRPKLSDFSIVYMT